jgi:signal peptidase II
VLFSAIREPVQMLKWLSLSLLVIVLDQLTKFWAGSALELHQTVEFLPFLDISLAHNTGAAFSFLSDAGGWQRWFFSALAIAVSVMIVFWLKRLPADQLKSAIALSLVLGGALGNVLDRILLGHVVDFIDFHYQAGSCLPLFQTITGISGVQCHWPAFNIADSAITLGAVLLIIDAFGARGKAEV